MRFNFDLQLERMEQKLLKLASMYQVALATTTCNMFRGLLLANLRMIIMAYFMVHIAFILAMNYQIYTLLAKMESKKTGLPI